MPTTQSPITLIGLGSMGTAIANTLLSSGHTIYAWNRTQNRPGVRDLKDRGAKVFSTAQAALKDSQIVIICVLNYETIYVILEQGECDLKSKAVINLTNGTPKEAREMANFVREDLGAQAYFDGAIMMTPMLLATDASFSYLSGESEGALSVDHGGTSVKEVLSCIGRIDYLGPDPGAAALHDLAFLAAMYGMFGGALVSTALLSKRSPETKASISDIIATNMVPGLRALLPSLTKIAAQVESKDTDARGHPNTMQLHGLKAIIETCKEEGVHGEPLWFLRDVFDEVESEGGGAGGMGIVGRKFWIS
jgi:3-hydroxyisobutyrate dehydrogenase-like beta-hydroxyacid dehydrogenase